MQTLLDFLGNAETMALAGDPRVLFPAVVVAIAAILMRWKAVLLLLFAVGGLLAVLRYSGLGGGDVLLDRHLLTFSLGSLAVGVVLIYFLFIQGD